MSEFFSHPVPAVIVLLGILVLVHEAGHFVVGRLCGIAAEAFSIGFGPAIVRFKRGVTEYRLNWIPLGGYVKFWGATPQEDVPEGARGLEYWRASVGKRMLTVAAGPLANFILAVFAYALLGAAGVSHPPAQIGDVIEGSAAQAAGFVPGDLVRSIDGESVESWRDIERRISKSPGRQMKVEVQRGASRVELSLTPAPTEATNMLGKKVTIGRAGVALGYVPPILTVSSRDSLAAKAGLKTGDEVESLRWGDRSPRVFGLWSFLDHLREARVQGATEVTLVVRSAKVPSLDLPEGTQRLAPVVEEATRQIVLSTEAWPDVDVTKGLTVRAFGAALGIQDSQLTLGEIAWEGSTVLKPFDRIIAWNGEVLPNVFRLREIMMSNREAAAKITLIRDFNQIDVDVPLHGFETQLPEGRVTLYALVVSFLGQPKDPEPVVEQYDGVIAPLTYGIRETVRQSGALLVSIGALFSGDVPLKAIGGPIMIAKVAGDAAKMGWEVFIASMALISINLGLVNLLPIPILDGGQLLLLSAEAVRRRPLADSAIENFQKLGFAMILALVLLATYNDLSRFWKNMLESVVGRFQ
jgi:regulator of sigma E protease